MLEVFSYSFIINALIVGTATAVTAALLGNFVVAARQSVISDMLAHAALAGVGVGLFFHASPSLFAGFTAIVASVLLWVLTRHGNRATDAVSMLLLSGGLSIALVFAHAAKDNPISLESFLFGSILTITNQEVVIFTLLCFTLCGITLACWRQILVSVFDSDFAHIQIRHAAFYEILLLVMIGGLVAIALKVVGGLLVGALLVIPALAAQSITNSFQTNVLWSISIGVLGTICGILVSFYMDIPTSSSIVLSLIALFILTQIYARIIE